jgi:hypothetical protein
MISIVLTIIGLVLNMIGVFLLYCYGPPIFTILTGGSEVVTWTDTENSEQAKQKAQIAKRRIRVSKYALLIIIVGLGFQIIGQLAFAC